MAEVMIRLKRLGGKKWSHSRIIVIAKTRARNGRAIEELGFYDPKTNPANIKINLERTKYWIDNGAIPSPTVKALIRKAGKQSVVPAS